MTSKLSVQSILTLIDNMSYEDEQLLYKHIINKFKFYTLSLYSLGEEITKNIYAENEDRALQEFIKLINLSKIKSYISYKSWYNDIEGEHIEKYKCIVCNNKVVNRNHVHEQSKEEAIEYVRKNINVRMITI